MGASSPFALCMSKPTLLFYDTCFYIDVFRGRIGEHETPQGPFLVVAHTLVLMELWQGVRRSGEERAIQDLEGSLSLIGASLQNYLDAGRILRKMSERKWLRSHRLYETQNDVLLALSAVENNSWIVTANRRDFDKIRVFCPVPVIYYLSARHSCVIRILHIAYNTAMPAPSLIVQTTYAELLERCASSAFSDAFSEDGMFTSKTIKGKCYWYFQASTAKGRTQRYVGPETPQLLERIAHHKMARDDDREQRALVSTLVRSFGLPRPIPEIGHIIAALAKAGVFRLRGVLVGTMAYQAYSAMLGIKLPVSTLHTADVDVAQFENVSIAVKDHTPPILEILKGVNKTFRAVPHTNDGRRATSYVAKGGLRVDFLTPNEGPDTDRPQGLPAFQTDAQPL